MNTNTVITTGWSNPETQRLFAARWPDEPALRRRYQFRYRCGGCAFFAKFGAEWGLCCHPQSRHHLETVFAHFTCPAFRREQWGPHSFSTDAEYHCRCGGAPSEFWDGIKRRVDELVERANEAAAQNGELSSEED